MSDGESPPPGVRARIPLSTPHLTGEERRFVDEAFASNWIAPLGPQVDAFEEEFAEKVGSPHAVALASGTAALHLALLVAGVEPGDDVMVSTLTFAASVNPIRYIGARPILVDSERASWNLDPDLLAEALDARARQGRVPKALVVVHLYGQVAEMDPIRAHCDRHGVILVEDAAEALGADHRGVAPGTIGAAGIFSFNGNKIITTSGGGMLVTPHRAWAEHARKLATQARDPAPHYQHSEVGYNYRLSNLLAALGRGQLRVLEERVRARRAVFTRYREGLSDLPGLSFQPEAPWGRHTRWLTALTIDPAAFGADREAVRVALDEAGIEARPVWKPMHLQPGFQDAEVIGGKVSEDLFGRGLCLPSGSDLRPDDVDRVIEGIRGAFRVGRNGGRL